MNEGEEMMNRRSKGFTLIELLMVIMVIAILIGIALPRFRGLVEEGNIAKAKGELRTLQTAVESYYMHNSNVYPSTLTALTSQTPQIVASFPKDPFNGEADYGYEVGGTNSKYYVIYSKGVGTGGTASISSDAVSETSTNVIYASNAGQDTKP